MLETECEDVPLRDFALPGCFRDQHAVSSQRRPSLQLTGVGHGPACSAHGFTSVPVGIVMQRQQCLLSASPEIPGHTPFRPPRVRTLVVLTSESPRFPTHLVIMASPPSGLCVWGCNVHGGSFSKRTPTRDLKAQARAPRCPACSVSASVPCARGVVSGPEGDTPVVT